MKCDFYWGSHGCDLEEGHEGVIHECGRDDPEGICSQHNEETSEWRFAYPLTDAPVAREDHEWSEWKVGSKGFRMGEIPLVASFEETFVSVYAQTPEEK